MSDDETTGLKMPGKTSRSRSEGTFTGLLLKQRDNLSAFADQCLRGRRLIQKSTESQIGAATLSTKIEAIQRCWSACTLMHQELLMRSDAPDVKKYLDGNEFSSARVVYNDIEEQLAAVKDLTSLRVIPEPNAIPGSSSRVSTLERISIPQFSGDSKDWPYFKDLFTSLVIDDSTLSNVQKFHYLKRSLSGLALCLIKNVPVDNNTFVATWKIVCDNYQDTNVLTFSHIVRLLKLEPVQSNRRGQLETLIVKTREILTSLEALGEPIAHWSSLLVVLTLLRLDSAVRTEWEIFIGKRASFPKYKELEDFLRTRVHAETVAAVTPGVNTFDKTSSASKTSFKPEIRARFNSHMSVSKVGACQVCGGSHSIESCDKFIKMTVVNKYAKVRENKLCFNCLRHGHWPRDCNAKPCKKCNRRHHSLLHESPSVSSSSNILNNRDTDQIGIHESIPVEISSHTAAQLNSDLVAPVLLATAWVQVVTQSGRVAKLRALLDQGSERSFISESATQLLCANRHSFSARVEGVGGQLSGHIKQMTRLTIESLYHKKDAVSVDLLILPKLTSYAPKGYVDFRHWPQTHNIALADPDPSGKHPIDLILGADVYRDVLLEGVINLNNGPLVQNTIFGWVLSGSCRMSNRIEDSNTVHSLHVVSNVELNNSIKKFWELEEIPFKPQYTQEEQFCEDLFIDTTSRDDTGRYQVHLPFKRDLPVDIGNSYLIACKFYNKLERRFIRDPELGRRYHAFLQEYLDLGHMVPYLPLDASEQCCYFPHHPVLKENSSTSKLRVVFNASSLTSNGKSLNDNLHIGPKLQQDLSSILMRWRLHRYVMSADIEKMFRQIIVTPNHSRFQLILWRPPNSKELMPFRLTTVTYGTAPAPYLALKVLRQLAFDESLKHPLGSHQLLDNTFVDDTLFGADTFSDVRLIRDDLLVLTNLGGFSLRKWCSNSSPLLTDLPAELCEISPSKDLSLDESLKILGIHWYPREDCFKYSLGSEIPSTFTKRTLLSHVSKLFDPLGWLSPVIVTAKILLQHLWSEQLDWDTPLPNHLTSKWELYLLDLKQLTSISLPRWIGKTKASDLELHGFCDASKDAYAAAVYLRISNSDNVHAHLVAAKTKVAPLKTLTIPRLELCAAELLTRLLDWVRISVHLEHVPVFAWSDSSVTLSWIGSCPSKLKLFVANRVARIQNRSSYASWRHVPTVDNPADLGSRGSSIAALRDNDLWWHGPSWMCRSSDFWPSESDQVSDLVENEEHIVTLQVSQIPDWDLSSRYSDWSKLIRVTAMLFRFISILRKRILTRAGVAVDDRQSSSGWYIEKARSYWLKFIQKQQFSDELYLLQTSKVIKKSSKLIALDPFIDSDGFIRVKGRLTRASMNFGRKHPIILDCHPLTRLIIKHAHLRTLHGGTSLTMRVLFDDYWIIRAKVLIRAVISKCLSCARYRASLSGQRMADLPDIRVSRARTFQRVGVDYAGPISIRAHSGRGHTSHKAYIAVFVCLVTRAVHLELVFDYTSNAFLAAFRRFCARRGLPSLVLSDNGTTFQGASKELLLEFRRAMHDPKLATALADDCIEWRFIPPSSPHFGGIWEAGVKTVKHHLRRIVGDHTLTGEEFRTFLCQVESCLNSRPIAGFSSDPNDLSYLTPGHFLVGAPLLSIPGPSILNVKENLLNRWKHVQAMTERFWRVWSKDYLNTLQKRYKWRLECKNLKVGDIVLIHHDNLPPSKWELGRVLTCHAGQDGLVRVCDLKTATGQRTRSVHKLCLLPVSISDSSSL